MIASDPVETKRISLGSVFEHPVPALTGYFMVVQRDSFIMTLDCLFQGTRLRGSQEECHLWGEHFPHCSGQQYFKCRGLSLLTTLRSHRRRKRRLKELDSQQNHVEMLPCQLPQRNVLFCFVFYFCLFYKKIIPCLTFISSFNGKRSLCF